MQEPVSQFISVLQFSVPRDGVICEHSSMAAPLHQKDGVC